MQAYRVASGRKIEPFGELARDLYIGVQTLAQWQEQAVQGAGLTLVDVASLNEADARPALVFFDDVFFTEMALRNFLADAMTAQRNLALAVPAAQVLSAVEPLQDARPVGDGGACFDIFYLVEKTPGDREALAQHTEPSLIEVREHKLKFQLPPTMIEGARGTAQQREAPLTARVVANVRHWLHLLRLSQLSIGVTLLDRLRRNPRLLFKLRMRRKEGPFALSRMINFVHPTAQVHPTADLESAVIGPGARVLAHAHVHRSVVGEGAVVGDHAVVMGSTLAEGVQVLRGSYVALCSAMPGGALSNYKVQLSLFGRDVFLTASAALIDAKFNGEVRIQHDGELVSSGSSYLGVCLGHRVTVGAHVTIQAGRSVPNGLTLVCDPGRILKDIKEYPEGTVLRVHEGTLKPL